MNLAAMVHEQLMKTAQVKNLYKGDCRGCGECCSRFLPLSKKDIERIKAYTEENDIKQRPEGADIDLTCPYLTEDKVCAIYEARPDICRAYRCDFQCEGYFVPMKLIMREEEYDMADMREVS